MSEGKKVKVLFIDDERLLLEQAKIFLEDLQERIMVDTVTSAEKGLNKLEEDDYEAIVSDYKMPGMGALELLKKLRKRGNDIPFIIFTGRGSEEVAQQALDLGADYYMRKTGDAKSQYDKLASRIIKAVESKTERVVKAESPRTVEKKEKGLHARLRHDLKNKVHLIKGFFQLLEDTDLDENQEEILKKAKQGTEEMSSIIEKVRLIKKAGEAEMEKIYFDPILSDVIEEYRPKAEKKGIDITLDENIKESQMSVIGGDLLYALFSNILENSIQHSDCDKIKISKKQSQDRLTVIIEDDGIGIPDESKGKLSDMDFKEGRNAGSGLGMYLVKNIVDTYNGDLKIKDSELGGARFEVSLRLP